MTCRYTLCCFFLLLLHGISAFGEGLWDPLWSIFGIFQPLVSLKIDIIKRFLLDNVRRFCSSPCLLINCVRVHSS
ncbi:hypothetical protein V8C35DRAFT_123448 [Trichoderma chlorosporum]